MTTRRLYTALGAFVALGGLVSFTLTGRTRLVTLILVGAIALKTVLAYWHERVK